MSDYCGLVPPFAIKTSSCREYHAAVKLLEECEYTVLDCDDAVEIIDDDARYAYLVTTTNKEFGGQDFKPTCRVISLSEALQEFYLGCDLKLGRFAVQIHSDSMHVRDCNGEQLNFSAKEVDAVVSAWNNRNK